MLGEEYYTISARDCQDNRNSLIMFLGIERNESETMEKITIRLTRQDSAILEEMLKEKNLEFTITEKTGEFLPSKLKEIVIALTQPLVQILYDYLKSKRGRSEIIVKTEDMTLKLDATNIKKLELLLDKRKRKESA